jgi:hypothetical protein
VSAWLPDDRILIAGDLCWNRIHSPHSRRPPAPGPTSSTALWRSVRGRSIPVTAGRRPRWPGAGALHAHRCRRRGGDRGGADAAVLPRLRAVRTGEPERSAVEWQHWRPGPISPAAAPSPSVETHRLSAWLRPSDPRLHQFLD